MLEVVAHYTVVTPELHRIATTIPSSLKGVSGHQRLELLKALSAVLENCKGLQGLQFRRELDDATGAIFEFYPRDRTVRIEQEGSVVSARIDAGLLASKVGFGLVQRTKFPTAVSELARNIYMYAGKGEIHLRAITNGRIGALVEAIDAGPGIANLELVFSGSYRSKSGLGMGLRGVKSIASEFSIQSAPGKGTRIQAEFY